MAWLLLAGGCASVTMGDEQTIMVETSNCGKPTQCSIMNKKGSWDFTAPGSVTIKKSDDSLVVRCQDGDDYVTRSVTPNKDKMIWGNVILGGGLGAFYDAHTDAHWEFPEVITIHRENCNQ